MAEAIDSAAWSALLLGLAALFAGIGALRQPGIWKQMVDEILASPSLQFLSGMLELLTGALVYLANPWGPADVLACVMTGLGGLMIAEALVILGFCDIYSQLWVKYLAAMHRGWALFTALFGAVLVAAGMLRFH